MGVQLLAEKKSLLFSGFSFVTNKKGELEKENEGKLMSFLVKFKLLEQAKELENKLKELCGSGI